MALAAAVFVGACGAGSQPGSSNSPPATAGSSTAAPTVPPGAKLGLIPLAVVRTDDRTIVVNAGWGACQKKPYLVATEHAVRVILALVEPPMIISSGMACPLYLQTGTVRLTLPAPLGRRSLIDQSTGRVVAVIDEASLARVTVPPPGYRYSAIAPGAEIGLANGQPAIAATRTYSGTGASTAALEVVEFAGRSAVAGATVWPDPVHVVVHGLPALAQSDSQGGPVLTRALAWSEDGWVIVLLSLPVRRDQTPLSANQLMAVADGMVIHGVPPTPPPG